MTRTGIRWRGRLAAAGVASLAALLGSCGRGEAAGAERAPGPVRVACSIPPLAGLARELIPADGEVSTIIAPGSSPHSFEPAPGDIAALARADLVLLIGLGLEYSIPLRAIPAGRSLEMASSLGIEPGDGGHGSDGPHGDHDHGHDHAHDHSGVDAHLWLDPVLVAGFVPTLAQRLREVLGAIAAPPDVIEQVAAREAALVERVNELDRLYAARLAPYAGATIITQHAAWSRLADRYGLEVVGVVQANESMEPSPAHLAELGRIAEERDVQAIFTEPQLDAAIARRLADQLGVPLGTIDPLGAGDWHATMLANLDVLTAVLERAALAPEH